jgi:hypothetical protein
MDTPSTTKRQERPTRERQPQLSTIMSTPSVVMALAECQSDCKITVASLCCDSVQAKSTSSKPTGQRHLQESEPRSSPDMIPIWARDHHHPKCLDATVDRPCFLAAHSSGFHDPGLATQLSCVGHFNTLSSSAKTPHDPDNAGSMAVSLPPTLFATLDSSTAVYRYWGADPGYNQWIIRHQTSHLGKLFGPQDFLTGRSRSSSSCTIASSRGSLDQR